MDTRAKKYANRRSRLRQLIDERFGGNAAGFASAYGYTRSQIAQYLSEKYNNGRSLGEGAAEKLEDRVELEQGYFDVPADGSTSWPLPEISESKVRALPDDERAKFQTAILITAAQLGLDVKKD